MNKEPQIFARWIDPTINDLKIALDEANKQIDILSKEIERLKAREQECIDKYLAESKYRGEVEGKYVFAKYVIDELEKALKSHQYIKVNVHYGEYYVEIDEVLNFIKERLDKSL